MITKVIVQLQVFGVNALLNGFDVISIIPTGSGKSLIIFLFAMALPRMLGVANTMVVVGIAHNLSHTIELCFLQECHSLC